MPSSPPLNGTANSPFATPKASTTLQKQNNTSQSTYIPQHTPSSSQSTLSPPTVGSVLSPIASRMLERDAGAMASYLKSAPRENSRSQTIPVIDVPPPPPPKPGYHNLLPPDAPHLPANHPIAGEPQPPVHRPMRLRPSASAASLRSPPSNSNSSSETSASKALPRIRSTTLDNQIRTPIVRDPLPAVPDDWEQEWERRNNPSAKAAATLGISSPPGGKGKGLNHRI
jgi:hypothetical protein